MVDGAPGLEKALVSLWPDLPMQRCTGAQAEEPDRACAETARRGDQGRLRRHNLCRQSAGHREAAQSLRAQVRDKCEAVATSLEEAGDNLFTFTRLPVEQWKSARTTNAIERLHLEFKRRIKTQTVLPSAETAAMLFWALLASGQIVLRKVDGWTSIARPLAEPIDLAA